MKNTPTFQYSSLELQTASTEIRLLDLFPSQQQDPQRGSDPALVSNWESRLVCRLYKTGIKKPPHYKALSYVWGVGKKSHSICVNSPGKCGEASIAITQSLDIALRHLRNPKETVTLWIDQICINQADNDEKAEQVAMMGSIYTAASQVLVWLGPPGDGSDRLMDAWQDVGQKARDIGIESYMKPQRYHLMSAIVRNEDPTDEATMHFQNLLAHSVDVFAPIMRELALKTWFERPYFSRVWIIQEFCLCADTVFVCGTKTVAVELVKLAMTTLQMAISTMPQGRFAKLQPPDMPLERLGDISEESISRLFSCRSRCQNRIGDELHILLRRMFVGHDTRATEHRDRVFALLGLASDAAKLGIQIDYGSAEGTTERVLTQAARAIIERTGRIDILSYSQFPKLPQLTYLPSWVPDWRSDLCPSFYTINERIDQHLFFASGKDSIGTIKEPQDNANIIGIRGYKVDVIDKVAEGDAWQDVGWDPSRYLDFFAQMDILWKESMRKPPMTLGPSRTRKEEARWRVPIGDIYKSKEGDQHRATSDVGRAYEQFMKELNLFAEMTRLLSTGDDGWEKLQDLEKPQPGETNLSYDENIRKMHGKKPFVTETGYLGMGPSQAEPGDIIIVFCGGHIPFVLRPSAQSETGEENMFLYVGEAYCDGIMDGEIIGKEEQTLWLA